MPTDVNPGNVNTVDIKNKQRSDTALTLFIPDLFGLQPFLSQLSKSEQPQLTVLEKWLARGKGEKTASQDELIFSELGITLEDSRNKPLSAFSLLAESTYLTTNNQAEQNLSAYWLRADPVCIQPDRDTAVLMAHDELGLSMEEADKLVKEINNHFAEEPWELHAVDPQRWYLKLDSEQELITTPLNKVLAQDINPFLPRGTHAQYWLQCINEIQMLLHGSSINFERESRGMWTINSLWLWGGGVLPPRNKNIDISYTKIIADDILLQGIANYCEIECCSLDRYEEAIQSGKSFMLLDRLSDPVSRHDVFAYVQNLAEIEDSYLKRIDELLKQGKIKQVRLLSDKISVSVTAKSLRRWWKRPNSFAEL